MPNKTAMLYSMLTDDDYTDGSNTAALVEGLKAGELAVDKLYNAFERVAGITFPELDGYRQAFQEAGAPFVGLAGRGPALYTLVDAEEQGKRLRDALLSAGHEAYLALLKEANREHRSSSP